MKEKYILAHDVGTSGNKAALVRLDTTIVGSQSAHYSVHHPERGCAEQSPSDWWNAVSTTTRDLLDSTGTKPSDVMGLAFSAQMAGTLPVDAEGEALMPCMIWLDTRAAEQAKKIWSGVIKVSGYSVFTLLRFLRITGGAPGLAGKDGISKILWLKENEPDIYSETFKFLDSKDYLLYKSTGNFVTSRDNANITWLMDTRQEKLCWSDSILKKYGIDGEKLPEIKKSIELAGRLTTEAAEDLGLSSGTPVVVGAGDMVSAAIGSGAVAENQIHAYVGTSSWLAFHTSRRKTDVRHYVGSICSANPNMYLCVAEQETAGACLDWVKAQMFKENVDEVYELFNRMAADVEPGSRGLIFTPWLFGERAPVDNPTIRGGFHNLSLDHSSSHIVRAVLEGVAFNMKWALDCLEKLTQRADAINIIGGGALSRTWCQIFADVLNRRMKQVYAPREAGVRGAAIIAAVALGHIKRLEDAERLVRVDEVFEPNPQNAQLYEGIFEEFKNIYKNNCKMCRRLNSEKCP